jgi:hypothetical protein
MCIFRRLENTIKATQVRGTPASGKTALAKLLHHHILEHEPQCLVLRLRHWKRKDDMVEGGWRGWLRETYFWDAEDGSVLIVDEAQGSYWDTSFWIHIKGMNEQSKHRIITLASYGSTGTDPTLTTPYSPPLTQVIGLHAFGHRDGSRVGLLLSKEEFRAFVEKRFQGHWFDEEFLDDVHELTVGHVGACEDFLGLLQNHTVSHIH